MVLEKYPRPEDAPPLVSGGDVVLVNMTTGMPLPRAWFINESDTRLIQFQASSLHVNWRARGENPKYPRYPEIRKDFEWAFGKLEQFAADQQLGPIRLAGYELTYVNRLVPPEGEEANQFVSRVFHDFSWQQREGRFLSPPAEVGWRARFQFGNGKGDLNARLYRAIVAGESAPIVLFELSTKGRAESSSLKDALAWFDVARKTIVNAFADLTDQDIQREVWMRES